MSVVLVSVKRLRKMNGSGKYWQYGLVQFSSVYWRARLAAMGKLVE
jgi:hypothetical protein